MGSLCSSWIIVVFWLNVWCPLICIWQSMFLLEPLDPGIGLPPAPPPPTACIPSCGANAECQVIEGIGTCVCLSGYYGLPELGCTPQCVTNSDCSTDQACINQRCIDPCVGSCAVEAECRVLNHNPICSCRVGYTGDPFRFCRPIPIVPGMHLSTLSKYGYRHESVLLCYLQWVLYCIYM